MSTHFISTLFMSTKFISYILFNVKNRVSTLTAFSFVSFTYSKSQWRHKFWWRHKKNVTESHRQQQQHHHHCAPQRPLWFLTQTWCWWIAATAQVNLVLDVVVVIVVVAVAVAVETAYTLTQRDAVGLVFPLHCKVFTWKRIYLLLFWFKKKSKTAAWCDDHRLILLSTWCDRISFDPCTKGY